MDNPLLLLLKCFGALNLLRVRSNHRTLCTRSEVGPINSSAQFSSQYLCTNHITTTCFQLSLLMGERLPCRCDNPSGWPPRHDPRGSSGAALRNTCNVAENEHMSELLYARWFYFLGYNMLILRQVKERFKWPDLKILHIFKGESLDFWDKNVIGGVGSLSDDFQIMLTYSGLGC